MKKLLLQLIAIAIFTLCALAALVSALFNALLLLVFIIRHWRETLRMLWTQPVPVRLIVFGWLGVFALKALGQIAGT